MNLPRKLAIVFLGLTITAQLATPAWLIGRLEWLRRNGEEVLVPCRAIDPYDPLRGRYVTINPRLGSLPLSGGGTIERGEKYFLRAAPDEEGIHRFVEASSSRPPVGPYLVVTARRRWGPTHMAAPQLPFRRYYMNEKLAPEAERIYRATLREARSSDDTRVELRLRVHNGRGAVDAVLINGRPIEEHIKEAGAR